MKKYSVDYQSGTTGYGWHEETNRIDEVEGFVNTKRHEWNAEVTIWDNEIQDFIFWKEVMSSEPSIDRLQTTARDLRTRTREKI